jgi:hypothetical protein
VGVPLLDVEIVALNPAKLLEALPERIEGEGLRVGEQPSDPGFTGRLRFNSERHGESASQRGQQEAAAVHAGMVGQAMVRSQRRSSYSSPSQRCASSTVEKILMSAPL